MANKKISDLIDATMIPTWSGWPDLMRFEVSGDFGGGVQSAAMSWENLKGEFVSSAFFSSNHLIGLNSNGTNGIINIDADVAFPAGSMDLRSYPFGRGGNINTSGGQTATARGGDIYTVAGNGSGSNGGDIYTQGGNDPAATGGNIYTMGGNFPGGNIYTFNGGGSINTGGVGLVEFGKAGTRTSLVGTATADHTQSLPDKDGTLVSMTTAPVADNTYVFDISAPNTVLTIVTNGGAISSITIS